MDTGQWTPGTGQWTMDTGDWTVDTGHWTLDTGHWTDFIISVFRFHLLVLLPLAIMLPHGVFKTKC